MGMNSKPCSSPSNQMIPVQNTNGWVLVDFQPSTNTITTLPPPITHRIRLSSYMGSVFLSEKKISGSLFKTITAEVDVTDMEHSPSSVYPRKLLPSAWQLLVKDWIERQQAASSRKLTVAQKATKGEYKQAGLNKEEEPHRQHPKAAKDECERHHEENMHTLAGVRSQKLIFLPPAQRRLREKQLGEYEIIITLHPENLNLAHEQPEPGFTFKGSTDYDLVVWKAIKFQGRRKEPATVHLPVKYVHLLAPLHFDLTGDGTHSLGFGDVREDRDKIIRNDLYSFAPIRTLVKRTDEPSWKCEPYRRPKLDALVLACNKVSHPVDFPIGTFHKTRSVQHFFPFLLIPNVPPGSFCIASQCAHLRVNAYIAQNIQERQRLDSDLFGVSDACDFTILDSPTYAAHEGSTKIISVTILRSEKDKELEAVPQPYLKDKEARHAPKILSPPLLGENGMLVSSLDQTTRWCLVEKSGTLELKIEPFVEV
ncbi:putative exp [Mycena sanguinolenta]|uniref:Putative exp n=1 Tax=Mycena sanguinolenta TaxID=230812 RepID=A0A8H6XJL4_9AGAR|nr:putative exp [Mycena sanguinolenta]